jgi:hypothetical protein
MSCIREYLVFPLFFLSVPPLIYDGDADLTCKCT